MITRIISLFIGLLIFLSSTTLGEELTARMTHADYAPYFTQQKKYKKQGMIIRIVDEIFLKAGIKVEHIWRPYARSINELRNGDYPVHLGNSGVFSKEDLKEIIFVPMVKTIFGFYSFKDVQIEFNKYEDLKKYRLASYVKGVPQVFLKQHGVEIDGKSSAETLVKMLNKNRLDFVTTECMGFATYAKDLFPNKKLYISKKILIEPKGGALFSLKHKDGKKLSKIFKREFDKYFKSGKYRRTLKEYYDAVGWDVDLFLIQ